MTAKQRRSQLDAFLDALGKLEARIGDRLTSLDKKVDHYTAVALAERKDSGDIVRRLANLEKRIGTNGVKA